MQGYPTPTMANFLENRLVVEPELEAEWTEGTEIRSLLHQFNSGANTHWSSCFATAALANQPAFRKLRLWACGCSRLVWDQLSSLGQEAVRVAEERAKEQVSIEELTRANHALLDFMSERRDGRLLTSEETENEPNWLAAYASWTGYIRGDEGLYHTQEGVASTLVITDRAKCDLLRCVIGNLYRPYSLPMEPFWKKCELCAGTGFRKDLSISSDIRPYRPYHCNKGKVWNGEACSWLTPTVCAIARQCYSRMEWEGLPILADALEDAGCTEPTLLTHLRAPTHCRGCWVLDLLL